MIRLLDAGQGLKAVLPGGRDPAAWYAALTAEIETHLSAAHARVLARPDPALGGLAWLSDGTSAFRYGDLPEAGRRQLDAALGAILSDIRRLAESGVAPAVRTAWPALRSLPDMSHVFAVDGRPVLAGWGHVSAVDTASMTSRLARLDDGVPWRATPRTPWVLYGSALAVLALMALASGLLLPLVAPRLAAAPGACAIVPGQIEAMRGQAAEESRGADLRTLLASLDDEIGRRRLQCPIPTIAAPRPAPAPTPTPAPTPVPPRADLPQERWDRGDLSMLEGCWNLRSSMRATSRAMPDGSPIATWRQCFDGHGAGRQTIVLQDGRRCESSLGASFVGENRLRVTESQPCTGTLMMAPSERICRRISDSEAVCDGRNISGPLSGMTYSGTFRR